ncbi:MAG: L,D-transpeptidase family protein [Hyphomicrobiaceae bacterium]|nr:L,D-transpeptidase family protein [Hyphomicrobiaceae bacterium]
MSKRGVAVAILGSFIGSLTSGVALANTPPTPRVWTDHLPNARATFVPPVPDRPRATSETAALVDGATVVPMLEPIAIDPLRAAILQEIVRLKSLASDDRRDDLVDQLGGLYGSEFAGPFWVGDRDFLPKARQVVAEILRADEYAIDARRFELPEIAPGSTEQLAAGEVKLTLALLDYANEAFGGRFNPHDISLWLDHKPSPPDAAALLDRVAHSNDPSTAIRALHPSHPQFEKLRLAYLEATGRRAAREEEPLPQPIAYGPRLRVGADHPDVALVRARLDVPAVGVAVTYFDDTLADAVEEFMRDKGKRARRQIDDNLRRVLNAPLTKPRLPDVRKIEANMMRWRWMPRDLGQVYVWNNLPEFQTRLFRNGEMIHTERIIIGQPDSQTPVFSDKMEHVVFKPQWGVPNSMKVTDLLPRLRGGDTGLLERRGMRIVKDGKTVDASRINWSKVDIRYLSIVQGPGDGNPLGELKFMFPNNHSVYMHDTTSKGLFASSERTFSHGCIRLRNPRRFAEVIFGDVQKWDPALVKDMLAPRAEQNRHVDLEKPIQVHNVYFTLVADEKGRFTEYKDVYGHDRRIGDAIGGKSLKLIAANDPARLQKQRVEEVERASRNGSYLASTSSSRRARLAGAEGLAGQPPMALGAPAPRQRSSQARVIKPSWPPMFFFAN